MPDLPFPASSTPGSLPGEGEGRLINAYVEKAGDTIYVRRVPGLSSVVDTGKTGPRAIASVNGALYVVYTGSVVKIVGTTVTTLMGSIPGSDGVTLARNNRTTGGVLTPDLVAVRESGGAYIIADAGVTAYPDTDLPSTVNSVAFDDGYFTFTNPDGRFFASDLNSIAVNALSFATAESKPDGAVRVIAFGGVVYVMGAATIEPWKNVGSQPFPLQRVPSVLPVGLLTTMAVAGFEEGWENPALFVANDGTVQMLDGYDAKPVSTPDVERFIANSDVTTLRAFVFTWRGHAVWALTSNLGTWCRDMQTGSWFERTSEGTVGWRAYGAVKVDGRWLHGDRLSGQILATSDAVRTEAGQPLVWMPESGPLKDYPIRVAVPSLDLDFTKAAGNVAVQWSHNGGQTWSSPVSRSLAQADRYPVRINQLGLSTHHGMRVRLRIADDVDFSFMRASVPRANRRAP